jgi:hypothetical protein
MKDPLLHQFVDQTEKGEYSGVLIWMIISGGLISGEIVPSWRAVDDLFVQVPFTYINRETGEGKKLSFPEIVPDQKYTETNDEGNYDFINLVSVTYCIGSQTFHFTNAKVKMDMVSAWWFGTIV